MRTRFITFFSVSILLSFILINSCSDSVEPEPTEDEDVTLSLNPRDSESGDVLSGAMHYNTESSDVIATGNDDLKREKGTELSVRTENDGYEPKESTLIFDRDRTVEIEMTPVAKPDSVTIAYSVKNDADESVADAELSIADTLVATGAEGSFTLSFTEQGTAELCVEAPYHEQNCSAVLLDRDQSIDLTLTHETMSISVTPEIVGFTDTYAANTSITISSFIVDNTIYYLSVGDSTLSGAGEARSDRTKIAEGVTTTIEYPAGPDPIPVSIRVEYFPDEGHEYSNDDYLNVAEGQTEVSGDADSVIQLDLEHIPACRDEVDNTFSGKMDAEELGCTDYQTGEYDTEDDVELIKGISITGGFGAPGFTAYIADGPGARVGPAGGAPTHETMHYATSPVELLIQLKWDDKDDAQAAAGQLYCGPDRNNLPEKPTAVTEITQDNEADGWLNTPFSGLTKDSYANEDYCLYKVVHASKVLGEPAGDGEGRINIANEETDGFGTRIERFFFQPEDVPNYKQIGESSNSTAEKSGVTIQEMDVLHPEEWMKRLDN